MNRGEKMYDTVVIESPEIDIETKDKILNFCRKYEGIEFGTGEIVYTFTRGELEGSYDYRIRVSVEDTEWIRKEEKHTPERIKSYWRIIVECSLHKLLMNHNCFGGSVNAQLSIQYLIKFLQNTMEVYLPEYKWWKVHQIDVATIFKFRDSSICKKIISNLKNAYYSRRKPMVFDTSVMFAGSTTTNKFYWKGPEFEKHDYKRIIKYIKRNIDMLQGKEDGYDLEQSKLTALFMKYEKIKEKANRIIRFECSIKSRKLKDLHDAETVYVYMLHDETLHNCMNVELRKIIKEDENMDIVRRSDLVLERLKHIHGTRLANTLYSTWCQMVQFGQNQTKEMMSKTVFYRHLKILQECGCSWACSTINLKPFSIVPADFSFLNDNYVDDSVDLEVIRKLEKVA